MTQSKQKTSMASASMSHVFKDPLWKQALRKGVWWQSESNSEEKAGVKILHAKTLQELKGRIRGGMHTYLELLHRSQACRVN